MADMTKHHRKPCDNCGHRDLHSEVTGCIAVTRRNPDAWCDCTAYVAPAPDVRPYAGSSGHSGSSTSRERAERRDASGLTSETQKAVLKYATMAGNHGITVAEARDALGQHHGTVSGALSNLHLDGILERLAERRNRCQVYVLPENVEGRETVAHRSNLPKAGGLDRDAVRAAIAGALEPYVRTDALDAAADAVMAL